MNNQVKRIVLILMLVVGFVVALSGCGRDKKKKTPVIVAQPTFSGILYYGDPLPQIITTTQGGTIKLDEGQILIAGIKDYSWTFTPTDTDNYIYTNTIGIISLTVSKKEVAVSQPIYDEDTLTYGDNLPPIITTTAGGTIKLDEGQVLIAGINDYAWTFTPTDIDNYAYTNVTGTISLTVWKKDVAVVEPTYSGGVLTYGDDLPLITTTTTGGTITLDENQVLKVGTHDYNWTFIPVDTDNYAYTNTTGTISLTVGKKEVAVVEPTYSGGVLTFGDDLPLITTTTTGGTIKLDEGQVLIAGINDYAWTFTPTDTDNYTYTNTTGTISLTVGKDEVAVVQPTYDGGVLTYGDDLPLITTTTIGGTIALDVDQVLKVGTHDYNWTFTPTDTDNYVYTNVTGTISLTVGKKEVAVVQPTYDGGVLTYDDDLPLITTTTTGGTITLDEDQVLKVDTHDYNWTFTPDDLDNYTYTNTTGTISLNVSKKEVAVVQPTYDGGVLTYGDELPLITTTTIGGTITLDEGQILVAGINDYSWTFTPDDLDNYTYTNTTGTISLTVGKKEVVVVEPTYDGDVLTYGDELPIVTTTTIGGTIKLDEGQILIAGTKDYSWTFTPTDTDNYTYTNITGLLSLTVSKKEVEVIDPTYSGGVLRYGDELPLIITTTTGGTMKLDEEQVLEVGTYDYDWTFIPDDLDNYLYTNTFGTISLEVEKGNQTIALGVEITAEEIELNSITLMSLGESFEYSIDDINFQDELLFDNLTEDTEYTFYARLKASGNYNASLSIQTKIRTLKDYTVFFTSNKGVLTGLTELGKEETDLITPSEMDGYKITSIGYLAFRDCTNLESIIISSGVTTIDQRAFFECSNLVSVIIPEGVTNIDIGAFANCTSLISVNIPNSVVTIGRFPFHNTAIWNNTNEGEVIYIDKWAIGCQGDVTTIILEDDTVGIIDEAFVLCYDLENITIPDSVRTIGKGAFESTKIWKDALNDAVVYIDKWVVGYKGSLTEVTIEDGTVGIANHAFHYCRFLDSIVFPDSLLYIGDYSFFDLRYLENVTITNNVTRIGEWAFFNCQPITSLTIPSSVNSIGSHAFNDCKNIALYAEAPIKPSGWDEDWNINNYPVVWDCNNNDIAEDGYIYYIEEGVRYGIKDNEAILVSQANILANVVIPDSIIYKGVSYDVTTIENSAFSYCVSLKSIILGKNLTSIGERAFYYCNSLNHITIPNNVTYLGAYAFGYCGLRTVIVGNGITHINPYTFYSCSGIYSLSIGDNVRIIGNNAFNGCSSLTGISIPSHVTSIEERAFYNCSKVTVLTISDSVLSIGNEAFHGLSYLTSITIPSLVSSVGSSVFSNCKVLTIYAETASKPSGWDNNWNSNNHPVVWNSKNNDVADDGYIYFVENDIRYSIKDNKAVVIKQPNSLEIMHISDSIVYKGVTYNVTNIESYAFEYCSNLKTVTIGQNVTSISDHTFEGCKNLTEVGVGDGVTSIGDGAFYQCNKLFKVFFSTQSKLKTISDNAFYGCSNLDYIGLLYNVESIGNYAFYGCSNLKGISIYNKVKTIGDYAFYNCTNLSQVSFFGTGVLESIGDYAFKNCTSLKNTYIFNSIKTIGTEAFCGCTSLENIGIGNSLTSIGYRAFFDCSSLKDIIIPNSVNYIGNSAFSGSSSLTIYCRASSQPSGWEKNWNFSNHPVVWGHTN